MKILITTINKRIPLINHFKKHFEVVGTDYPNSDMGKTFADKFYTIPHCSDESCAERLLEICEKENIRLILPLGKQELHLLDGLREILKEQSILLALSCKKTIEISNDKWEAYKFFKENAISTPESCLEITGKEEYPLYIKQRAKIKYAPAYKINDINELKFFYNRVTKPIIQQYVEGTEYSIDCLCDFKGEVLSVVPRERIEVRNGEVSKSRTCKDEKIIDACVRICNEMDCVGPITLQCIKTPQDQIKFVGMMPRMGSGIPLTFEAGVSYGEILRKLADGESVKPLMGKFKEITMIRYDEAIFV